jgi:hypothetical protein
MTCAISRRLIGPLLNPRHIYRIGGGGYWGEYGVTKAVDFSVTLRQHVMLTIILLRN